MCGPSALPRKEQPAPGPGNITCDNPTWAHTDGAMRPQERTGIPEAHGAAQQRKEKATPGMANTLLKGPRAGLAQHTSSRQSNIISGQGENPQPKIDTLPSCR
ncbi:hypothetical protein CapIbe_018476 [Capra ibex]